MADETTVIEQTQIPGVEIITPGANMFSDEVWSNTPIVSEPAKAAEPIVTQSESAKPVVSNEDIVDELEYLEKQTGYKSWDEVKNLKKQYEELQSKAQTPAEIKFANEESRQLFEAWKEGKEDEVYSFFDKKHKLKAAANLPAAEAIKLHLHQTNPHYKPEDVEDLFEERYAVPKKPVQMVGEEQESFDERMLEYTTRLTKVNRAIERDGFSAKQELAQRITELVPPEIPQAKPIATGPDPKVLEAMETARNAYMQKLETDYTQFDGFSTKVKDESAELPIAFKVDDKDKSEIKQIIQEAVFKNLDVNEYFTNRWFKKDASGALVPDINLMQEDFMLLEKRGKVFQGIANNSASSRLAHQIKLNSNIRVDGGGKIVGPEPTKDSHQATQIDYLWKNG